MIGKLKTGLAKGASAALSKTLRAVANRFLKRYGRLESFRLDLADRTIDATVTLWGESEPLQVRIAGFEFVEEDGEVAIVIRGIDVSKEWMAALAGDFVVGRPFALPEEAAKVVRALKLV